ncbi:hypothetical protein [Botrimarina mediterranea]|uniref:PEP-CTERM protein-sorting domain-containing protein n=1 Tax=Botrimarina mediterranea TaxID=2528022 RepID=A0A518K9E9_9BACT|nr:hypothetical protein [Botrimarina mediterranea]QDV74419.1 hypothetical protein Spa11_26220 [Botrimarina mediterranea]QDV79015.1 hypothetical protein K2D_26240 [Planctomycetes bacterium K2D]
MRCTRLFSLFLAGAFCAPALSASIWVPTNYGNGADAEVRESAPTQNRGTSTEIASRIKNTAPQGDPGDGGDRNSLIYVKIDLTNAQMPGDGKTAFRMTYRNNNMTSARVMDLQTPNPALRTGMAFYGLASGQTWDESTITYANAPGINFPGDANVGTRDLNSDLTFLGTKSFSDVGDAGLGIAGSNWNPVGGEFKFESAALDAFVQAAIDNGDSEVTIVSHVLHSGDPVFSYLTQWINFNYLFNPKEQVTLNADPNFDADVLDANNALGSPWSSADNSTGAFSPALLLVQVPEPTAALLCLGALAGLAGARRRG